jgi:DNA-3-methyladenine glycosylase I
METVNRCLWPGNDPIYQAYHDQEWGMPLHDDQALFELLILEGFQSGLSWITILRKRENFREAFENFDFQKLAQWSDEALTKQLQNPQIIRNRLKIWSVRTNARAFIQIQEKFGSFDRFIWAFVNDKPIQNHFTTHEALPASTELSERMSKELKKLGFKFVGPTICYSFMQAAGLVNDHITSCFCYENK